MHISSNGSIANAIKKDPTLQKRSVLSTKQRLIRVPLLQVSIIFFNPTDYLNLIEH